jgi:hypothetical protein
MAIAFRSIANTTYANRTNCPVTAPAGIVDGDILLLFGLTGNGGTSEAMTPPAGFAAVTLGTGTNPTSVSQSGFNVRLWCWWKRAASEAGNYTITHINTSSQGACLAISGAIATGNPWDVANSNSATSQTSTGSALTTTVANTLLVFYMHDFGDTANNLTPPTGMTERLDVAPLSYSATQAIAATGSTGTRTMTNNNGATTPFAAYMVALKPALTVSPPPFRRPRRFFSQPF